MENIRFYVFIIFVALGYQIEGGGSRNTSQCPASCLCITGDAGGDQLGHILDEQVISNAWNRFQRATAVESTVIYLCRNAKLRSVQHKMMSDANVVFLDENNIESLGTTDAVDNGTLDYPPFPTLLLSLSRNNIRNITVSFFRRLPYLKLIILRYNLLDNLRWSKGQQSLFPELLELDMSKNALRTLTPQDIGVFPSLIRLELSDNKIHFIDGRALLKFPRLEYLDLSSNQITQRTFYTNHTWFPSIKVLSLSNNAIDGIKNVEIIKLFRALLSLTQLDLSRNRIASKAIGFEAFSAFQHLRKLNLSSCEIEYFADGWLNGGPNATLKILDISRNLLTSVSADYLSALDQSNPNSRGGYYNMDKAKYRNRQNQTYRSLLAIEVLYLNDNYLLSEIEDEAFEYVPSIQLLFLQNCNLHRFILATRGSRHQPISSSLPTMTSIWIFGNPIACDCYLRPLILWSNHNIQTSLNQSYIKHEIDPAFYSVDSEDEMAVDVGFAVCSSPEKYSGMAVQAVPIESMTCVNDTYSIFIAMIIGPLSFAGAVILVVLCGSLHVLATKMRHNAMTVYYPKPEPSRSSNKQQKWHDPPAHCRTRSAWHGDTTSNIIGQHGGMYTNLVMGQIASRVHYIESRTEGPAARVAYEPRNYQAKRKSTWTDSDEPFDAVSKDIPYIDHGSDVDTKSKNTRARFSSTDNSSNTQKTRVDSRTDDTKL